MSKEDDARINRSVFIEPKQLYRADTDAHGDWFVWRRLSSAGWATLRRCESEAEAHALAEAFNEQHDEPRQTSA